MNIIKAQGFLHIIKAFPFSHNRQGILSTRLFFHEPKDKCLCLNRLPQQRFTVGISLNKKK